MPIIEKTRSSETVSRDENQYQQNSDHFMVGIYGGGVNQNETLLNELRASGFNTLICWTIHVNVAGELIYNDGDPIVMDGKYTGPGNWPSLLSQAVALPSTLRNLVFSVGSWGSQDFANIRALMLKHGDSNTNPLRANFGALKTAIPSISVIDMDNEDNFDKPTIVSFSRMLHTLGYRVTFCPYHRMEFWSDCLRELYTINADIVVGYNLQCYAGGVSNASREAITRWIDSVVTATGMERVKAAGFIRPGLWCTHTHKHEPKGRTPAEIQDLLSEWKDLGIRNAWLWLFDDILNNKDTIPGVDTSTSAYARAVISALCE